MRNHFFERYMASLCVRVPFFMLICLSGWISQHSFAYSLRQFSSKNGLSNSAILSLCQDSSGLLWIGSCDGLNVFDGASIRLYKPADMGNNLSGNLIDNMMEEEGRVLWIQTNYGLDRLDTKRQTVQTFKEFQDINLMAKSIDNDVYVLKDDGYLYYIRRGGKKCCKLPVQRFAFENVRQMVIDSANTLWFFSSDGDNRSYTIHKEKDNVKLVLSDPFQHQERLLYAFSEGNQLYFIDQTYALYEYDLLTGKKLYVTDLEEEVKARGEVSSVIKQHNDYFVGFKSRGLICLKSFPDRKVKYEIQPLNIKSGIFCLKKDRFQDIIWVGTDGQGVYMCFADLYSIRNTILDVPAYGVDNPVRALLLDDEQTMWVGTKGGGILRMLNYHAQTGVVSQVEHLLTGNSALTDNSVYCFAPSHWGRLWIGTEAGMNYYSYKEKCVRKFEVLADGKVVKYVHSICELNDSTLWVATVGEGIVKVSLDTSGSSMQVRSAKRFMIDQGRRASNYFFVAYQESDSVIWFGNRGYGAYRVNTQTEQIKTYRFDQAVKNQTVNDIYAILKNKAGYWFGTSFGLTRLHNGDYRVYNETDGFPNNTIHGILEDGAQNLWLSTNQGLVRFNMERNTVQTFRQQNSGEVTEFSDGAFFKDQRTGMLFFGGINGFVSIRARNDGEYEYMPVLHFNHLSIFGKEHNLHNFLQPKDGREVLTLAYKQNFFSLSFVAMDYINGNNYTYFYKIDGLSDNWVDNGTSTAATFSNLAPGEYTLLVKYRSNISGFESKPYSLLIRIVPPWYMTTLAYWCYFLLLLLLLAYLVFLSVRKYRRKQQMMIDRINRQKRDELYESKLRFFTNITHEFCTPLTLIYGPCEKILSNVKTDAYTRKYASMILQNAKRLNALILELIEFRRLETGHKELEVRSIQVSAQTKSIAESFVELAESRGLDFQIKVQPDVFWNTDESCLNKIVSNLISNAFKYTPDSGVVIVEQRIEEEMLCLCVSNSGKGILKKDLPGIFDRYKVLDNFEAQNKNGFSQQNGLGLAICHSMVHLLNGQISVTSLPDELTSFKVTLPMLEITAVVSEKKRAGERIPAPDEAPVVERKSVESTYDPSKPVVMIIDDDPSMLWFVTEILAGKYNVLPFDNAEVAINELKNQRADLIISDVMMPGMDGMTFARKLKSDKMFSHIPLIMLSALNNIGEQVKGFESGAEAYITKPFEVEYLEKVVMRLIQRKMELKEYFSSVYSTFELDGGRLLHKEDKAFFEKMMRIIDENIHNPELSVEVLSASLGYSSRQFYRKLKDVTDKTPADIIKEYRLSVAERMLISTNQSVDEIMENTGFINRGTFYKVFSQKNGMTPRQYREQKKKEVKEKERL